MTSQEFSYYWVPALSRVFGSVGLSFEAYSEKLERLLSKPEHTIWKGQHSLDDKPLSPEDMNMLKQLAGPHGKTIYRAACAKRGIEP